MRSGMLEGGGAMMDLECPLEPPAGLPHHHHHHSNSNLVSQTPSISSGASTVGGGRVRFVRLIRRRNESYGFSLRGGREHGTGFFISHVELGSEAYMQGLRAGDQVLRVNNLCVEQAIHREVTAMVQSKGSVILKVKSAGIIPVKEHRGDPLTWLVVDDDDDEEDLSDHAADSYSQSLPSSSSGHEGDLQAYHHPANAGSSSHALANNPSGNDCHARVVISYGGKVGLGCSICKGPAEKPGIFVQSVRAGGVARTAGLRPGDQILACNDISFTHLEFAEAVYVLKSSPRLVLDVLRGAGLDFVAGESSGYNSSASSVAGDQTPPSSSSDPRDSDHSVTSRLSAVSHHLTLDRSRGWREIEAEWADAEAAEKRRLLQTAQRTLKTRAQRDANHRLSSMNSRSLSNLSTALREEDSEESTAFRDAALSYNQTTTTPSPSHLSPAHVHYKPTLRSTRSSSDVTDDTSHKIAFVMSADPHVNNIVVSGGPKDEKDAVSRLEELSNPYASKTSTLSSGASQVTVRSSLASVSSNSPVTKSVSPRVIETVVEQQLRELREEQRRLQEEANRLAEERRKFEEAQAGVNGDDEAKAKLIQDKIEAFKKDKTKTSLSDPKRNQHDKLMEEFKVAHKRMFVTKDNPVVETTKEEIPVAKFQTHQKVTRAPASNTEIQSKIIAKMSSNTPVNKKIVSGVSNGSAVVNGNSKPTHLINDGKTSIIKWKEMLNSVPAANKSNPSPSTPKENQQQNERTGGSTFKPSVLAKSPLRPTPGKTVVIENFKPEEKSSPRVWPPVSSSETQRKDPVKPLISIGTYPSPNDRPTPVKLDFLPSASGVNVEVNGTTKYNNFPRDKLQNELTSTLTRSNIRQRLIPQELPPDPLPSSSTSNSSLSERESTPPYTAGGSRRECDEAESLPTGILKPSGPATSIRPLQKSISFGDVTTVGEDT